jgi:hypothetical protein
MIELSERIADLVDKIFSIKDRDEVRHLLEIECAENLPFCEDSDKYDMERIRISVLKLCEGSMDKLVEAIVLAQTDWRDLLVAAGFGHDTQAHKKWSPKN